MNLPALVEPEIQTHGTVILRTLLGGDTSKICSWVKSQKALELVSGDIADCLTPKILDHWIHLSQRAFVASLEPCGEPVGFCTITQQEAPLMPPDSIELCHLIVASSARYLFIGQRMCRAVRETMTNSGFGFLCGRVVPTNRYGLALCRSLRAEEFTGTEGWTPSGFRWFRLMLNSMRGDQNAY